MNSKLLAIACLCLVVLAACKPEPAETAVAAADAPPAMAETAVMSEGTPSEGAPTFDQKGFAGTFRGTLPCADCPGIDTVLSLKADGTYALTEDYQGDDMRDSELDGTWTAEHDDQHIRLDPNSKSETDRVYALVSNDEISPLAVDGKPATDGGVATLQREAAAQ